MDYWVPLISALVGALLGSATTVATMIIQASRDDSRDMRAKAVELALAEHRLHLELAKANGGSSLAPITAYFAHHLRSLKLARKGYLSPADMEKLTSESQAIYGALEKAWGRK